jgi:integrase
MGNPKYLFHKNGSPNWFVRFQSAGGKDKIKSLGTADKLAAEAKAAALIGDHKAKLLAARPRLESKWVCELEPGLHVGPDGGRIFATDRELHHLDAEGRTVRTIPNGAPGYQLVAERLTLHSMATTVIEGLGEKRPTVAKKGGDDAIIDTYLSHAGVEGYFRREAQAAWALYRELTGGKALRNATRDDGRKLVQYFEGKGLRSATIQKKIGWLAAAVNLAIKEGRGGPTINPFSSIVPKRDDKQRRLPLNEDDIKVIKRNLDRLDKTDQVLFRLLATTGMRLSEAFEIDGELKERGLRYVIVGKKTEQSLRRVPLPAATLPYLPKAIKGPLFEGGEPAASKRLNRFLRDIGIIDPRKVAHSARHRAQDRLRAAECPQDIRWALLGHEERTVAEDYGKGFSVPQLKRWIDRIGF